MTNDIQEFERIVEFSFQKKEEQFVIRFLNNASYVLKVADLPKKMLTKKPQWEEAELSHNNSALLVQAGKEFRVIPSHVIHSKGTLV